MVQWFNGSGTRQRVQGPDKVGVMGLQRLATEVKEGKDGR